MASRFKIGAAVETLVNLDDLDPPVPDPQPRFSEFVEMERLGNLALRGAGPQIIIWNFQLLEVAETAELESHKATDPIFIQSPDRFDVDTVYEVLMNWPHPSQDGEHMPNFKGYRRGLEIEFVILSEVEPS